MTVYWEPWKPKKGDRVRIRFSGECRRAIAGQSAAADHGLAAHEAEMPANGKLGTVTGPSQLGQGHYEVRMDERYESIGRTWGLTDAAAIEMEPLEAQPLDTTPPMP